MQVDTSLQNHNLYTDLLWVARWIRTWACKFTQVAKICTTFHALFNWLAINLCYGLLLVLTCIGGQTMKNLCRLALTCIEFEFDQSQCKWVANPHILRKSGFLVISCFLHSRYALPGNMQLPPRTVILRGYKSPALEGLIFSSLKKSAVVRRNRSEKEKT